MKKEINCYHGPCESCSLYFSDGQAGCTKHFEHIADNIDGDPCEECPLYYSEEGWNIDACSVCKHFDFFMAVHVI